MVVEAVKEKSLFSVSSKERLKIRRPKENMGKVGMMRKPLPFCIEKILLTIGVQTRFNPDYFGTRLVRKGNSLEITFSAEIEQMRKIEQVLGAASSRKVRGAASRHRFRAFSRTCSAQTFLNFCHLLNFRIKYCS